MAGADGRFVGRLDALRVLVFIIVLWIILMECVLWCFGKLGELFRRALSVGLALGHIGDRTEDHAERWSRV